MGKGGRTVTWCKREATDETVITFMKNEKSWDNKRQHATYALLSLDYFNGIYTGNKATKIIMHTVATI